MSLFVIFHALKKMILRKNSWLTKTVSWWMRSETVEITHSKYNSKILWIALLFSSNCPCMNTLFKVFRPVLWQQSSTNWRNARILLIIFRYFLSVSSCECTISFSAESSMVYDNNEIAYQRLRPCNQTYL